MREFGLFQGKLHNGKPQKGVDNCLYTMIRMMGEGLQCNLRELLLCVNGYLDVKYSYVVDVQTRQILSCSDDAHLPYAKKVAASIVDLSLRDYYLMHEKNAVFFPADCTCISAFPLEYAGRTTYALVVEQSESRRIQMDIVMELLAVAVRMGVQEMAVADGKVRDLSTGLNNRESLMAYLAECEKDDTEQYIGLIKILNLSRLSAEYGYVWAENMVSKVSAAVVELTRDRETKVYRYASDTLCVVFSPHYRRMGAIVTLQDVIDRMEGMGPNIEIGCVLSRRQGEPCSLMYPLEHLISQTATGVVNILKEADTDNFQENIQFSAYLADRFVDCVREEQQEEGFSEDEYESYQRT